MILNFIFQIFTIKDQKSTLRSWISLCRQQYNSALLDKQRAYQKTRKAWRNGISALC
ncbi:helix-turn-helix domain-containing protein [Domibacillus sp. PGB-M46]|uniref:helix-turn-helix domain-containing protein n=1 Tax=Domibacillus sp. PGB-M46 TaxID=2910255 RepID=UPI001F5725D0|nr:helix-turn-helix domain-containing protein [Domibacillus sp. PGB-M46]MCI2255213.1 helix-turn-helix domain-containing protein [Domibacillus sp. PGB-M46]